MQIQTQGSGWNAYQADWMDDPVQFDADGIADVDDPETARRIAASHPALALLVDPDESESDVAAPPLDPSTHTVSELETALAEHDYTAAELDALHAAETVADNRETALDAIDTALNTTE